VQRFFFVHILALFFAFYLAPVYGGANNNTPQDAFESYQIALRENNSDLLSQVYYFPDSTRMTLSRLQRELKDLKYYDGYKSYAITQVIDEGNSAKLKVKGTLRGRENVRRTFQLKRFNNGWKIVKVWNG